MDEPDFTRIIIAIFGLLILLITTSSMLRGLYFLIMQMLNMQPRYRDLKTFYKPYLIEYFKFYNALDKENKKLFERRVQFFIDLKTFIPRGGLRKVSDEVKVLIAASAIQITFGYPNVYFRHFTRILVYPDNYKNKLTKRFHKGEVNVKGLIALSVKSLRHGWVNQSDGINLGLHEMAHALSVENLVRNEEFGFINQQKVKALKELARPEMQKINMGGNTIFRKYGGANFREFFSVATEVFFEIPDIFKTYNPAMYNLMAEILCIDPVKVFHGFDVK